MMGRDVPFTDQSINIIGEYFLEDYDEVKVSMCIDDSNIDKYKLLFLCKNRQI